MERNYILLILRRKFERQRKHLGVFSKMPNFADLGLSANLPFHLIHVMLASLSLLIEFSQKPLNFLLALPTALLELFFQLGVLPSLSLNILSALLPLSFHLLSDYGQLFFLQATGKLACFSNSIVALHFLGVLLWVWFNIHDLKSPGKVILGDCDDVMCMHVWLIDWLWVQAIYGC